MKPISINISEFKAQALRLLAELSSRGKEYIIVKKGQPIARVLPFHKHPQKRRGSLQNLGEIHGDIVNVNTSSDWEVLK